MRKTIPLGRAVVAPEAVLPVRVQEALGELTGVLFICTVARLQGSSVASRN